MTSVAELSRRNPSILELKAHLRTQIKNCNTEIRIAGAEGKKQVAIALPVTFAVIGMNNRDVQLYIYASLIEHYSDMGHIVKLRIDKAKQTVRLIVSWENKSKDRWERKEMLDVVKAALAR